VIYEPEIYFIVLIFAYILKFAFDINCEIWVILLYENFRIIIILIVMKKYNNE